MAQSETLFRSAMPYMTVVLNPPGDMAADSSGAALYPGFDLDKRHAV